MLPHFDSICPDATDLQGIAEKAQRRHDAHLEFGIRERRPIGTFGDARRVQNRRNLVSPEIGVGFTRSHAFRLNDGVIGPAPRKIHPGLASHDGEHGKRARPRHRLHRQQ